MSSPLPLILWFRQDLRLTDHAALTAAMQTHQPIIPLFIYEEKKDRPWGGASQWWLHHSLKSLQTALPDLCLRQGDPLEILLEMIQKTKATKVLWSRRYTSFDSQTDSVIKSTLESKGIEVLSFEGFLWQEPWTIQNQSGKPFQIFTPFWKHYVKTFQTASFLPAPKKIPTQSYPSENLKDWNLLPSSPNWAAQFDKIWTPGERGAQQRWDSFLQEGIQGYQNHRDILGKSGTSRLSAALHWGEISPRQIWVEAQQHLLHYPELSTDVMTFLSELGWREFAQHLLYHHPQMKTESLRPQFSAFPWKTDSGGLKAWQKGQTGYPIVDAGMRQLWQTGIMHNRVRMIVASFLVKNLLISWQAGEAWFWDTLVDADLGANTMNWQWVTGCGVDSAPYYRIFNPILQGQKFDGKGEYVRQWVPELKDLPNAFIHSPWEASPGVLSKAGITLGKTYPHPIVDHPVARQRALEVYRSLKG